MTALDGRQADDPDERVLDLLFPPSGCCEDCLPRRVPARLELWCLVDDPAECAGLAFAGEEIGPACWRSILCDSCVALRRAEPTTRVVRIQPIGYDYRRGLA